MPCKIVMVEIDKKTHINRLLDLYGRLLTKNQFDIMSDYYYADLSLSEISEYRKISRTAVLDSIKKSTQKLENYEEKVGICKVFDASKTDENRDLIDKLEEMIKDGI